MAGTEDLGPGVQRQAGNPEEGPLYLGLVHEERGTGQASWVEPAKDQYPQKILWEGVAIC